MIEKIAEKGMRNMTKIDIFSGFLGRRGHLRVPHSACFIVTSVALAFFRRILYNKIGRNKNTSEEVYHEESSLFRGRTQDRR